MKLEYKKFIKKYIEIHGIHDYQTNFEEDILSSDDSNIIYNIALQSSGLGLNVDLYEDAIIRNGSSKYIYLYARDIFRANIEKLENALIKTNSAIDIFWFALNIPNANIYLLEDAIIKT